MLPSVSLMTFLALGRSPKGVRSVTLMPDACPLGDNTAHTSSSTPPAWRSVEWCGTLCRDSLFQPLFGAVGFLPIEAPLLRASCFITVEACALTCGTPCTSRLG